MNNRECLKLGERRNIWIVKRLDLAERSDYESFEYWKQWNDRTFEQRNIRILKTFVMHLDAKNMCYETFE